MGAERSRWCIGIDLGGTKIEAIALDALGQERYRQRIATPNNYNDTLDTLAALVQHIESELSMTATVGVGIPGSLCQRHQTVKNANSVWLNGQPLYKDLTDLLARDVRIANDANCFAISEAIDGAGKGAHCVFGVIIGTGCGGGVVIGGKPLLGHNGLGGEWGHNPLPFPTVSADLAAAQHYMDQLGSVPQSDIYRHKPLPSYTTVDLHSAEYPGPLCYCGKRGCLETWLSGVGFQNDYQRLTGEALTAPDIVALARAGHAQAQITVERYCERLAKSLAQMINILDPDVIVLGGGMSNVDELYQQVPERWQAYTFTDHSETQLLPAMHGDASGVRGAAWLWNDQ